MIYQTEFSKNTLRALLKAGIITLGGNRKLKIYGRLDCLSGKRMMEENRVFFINENDAGIYGYRPCAHCLRSEYLSWKNGSF